MPQDGFTLRVASRELNDLLCGGKINKITQPNADEICMLTYAGGRSFWVVASTNARYARVCPTDEVKESPAVAPNFCMLLRKHLAGATVSGVTADGYERIVKIRFDCKNDFRESVEKTLICELMGKYSNVILTEGNKILGTLKQSGGSITGARQLFTGMEYSLPPQQDKCEITDKTCVLGHFCGFEGPIDRLLCTVVKGVATQTAREIVYRFFGTVEANSFGGREEEFYQFALWFLSQPEVNACVNEDGGTGDFTVCDYTHTSGIKRFFPTVIEAQRYYFDRAERVEGLKQKHRRISEKLKAHDKKLRKKLQMLTEKLLACEDYEQNRIKGEILTAFQHQVRSGSAGCELPNFYSETGETIKIALDKTLSVNKNAQNYFKKYAKQKKALSILRPQIEEIQADVDYLEELSSMLLRCETASDYDALTEELKELGLIRVQGVSSKKKEKPSAPKTFDLGGFSVLAGKNNLQNDQVTFGAKRDDVWLHTKDIHSSHVIICCDGRPVPDEVLLAAAEICAHYSKARGNDKVPVDYCYKKYVKKPPKAKPGAVIYTNFKTLYVCSNAHASEEKK